MFLEFESRMASKKSNNAGFGPAQRYKALWDYKRRKNDELSFARREILVATLASEANWLVATNRQGQRGLIPENYVRPVKIKPKKEEKQQIHSNSAVSTAFCSSPAPIPERAKIVIDLVRQATPKLPIHLRYQHNHFRHHAHNHHITKPIDNATLILLSALGGIL